MMQKSNLSNFCMTNVRNLKVFLEIHRRDIAFAKSEQSYHFTSTDAEAAAVRLLLPLHRKRHIPVILHCMHICEMALNLLNPYLTRTHSMARHRKSPRSRRNLMVIDPLTSSQGHQFDRKLKFFSVSWSTANSL